MNFKNMFAKFILILMVVLTTFNLTSAAIIKSTKQDAKSKEPWELMEALKAKSSIRGFNGTWITNDVFIYTSADKNLHKYNVVTKEDLLVAKSAVLSIYGYDAKFVLSPDNKNILISYDVEAIFRHSKVAKYDVLNLETGEATKIHKGKKLQYCNWSPKMNRLAFVFQNNVYVRLEDGSEVQLTTDGVIGVVYNGIPDWVYEEEVLSTNHALWWSPDGLKLAVGNFNDTNVMTFNYTIYGNANDLNYQYPREESLKYPKPGSPNPTVELRLFSVTKMNKIMSPVILKAPINIVSNDHIMQSVVWTNNNNLLILWLNRRQNLGTMQLCELTGQCREVKRFLEPDGWIKIDVPHCQSLSDTCVFSYWIGNWFQVWKLDLKTGSNLWTSRGEFTVTSLYGYDELNDKLYYAATLKGQPYVNHIFSNENCLSCSLRDLDNEICQYADASFSKNFSYYRITCTGPGPSYTRIFDAESNKLVTEWESNLDFREKVANKLLPTYRFLNVTLSDGSTAAVRLKLPPNLNEKKKYPMIVFSYGGPDSVKVKNEFEIGFDSYITTNRNVIYATIDGRGTGNKGKKLLFSVNNDLGHYEAEDQIFVTKYLQKELPYVDRERTGIWGWSYGGYLTAKVIAADSDRVFQCGISVAPVTSWLYYDSIYSERYLGVPALNQNYKSSSVFQNVQNFRNHDFLLIHGSADDNVHYQQSLVLAKVLESKDILFEQMTYVDENHSIGSFSKHLYHTMDRFWTNYLSLDADDEE